METTDDSMSFKQEIPLAHHEENYVHLGEASRFLKQNDDSLKEEGRVPFKNDQEHGQVDKTNGDDDADGGSINENDDSVPPWQKTTKNSAIQDEAFMANSNADDDSVAFEEQTMAETTLASKYFSGRGNDVNERLDDVDLLFKRTHPRFLCAYCCRALRY